MDRDEGQRQDDKGWRMVEQGSDRIIEIGKQG